MLRNRHLLAMLAALALAGADRCRVATAPVDGANVRIVLAVSGGIAGVDWQVTIDGREGRITGDRCRDRIACEWEPGEELAIVTRSDVTALAHRFFEARFFEGEADHGTQCCDQFEYVITYEDSDDVRTVTGSSGTLPDRTAELVADVIDFVEEARGAG